jgi:uncharacterized repeat protein (TIGR01451 family)
VALSEVGTYTWSASYSGDSLNNGAVDNGHNESVTSIKASPAITTTPSESTGSVGDVLNDTAHLSGGSEFDGSGTITFNLYGPGDSDCSGTPAYTETVSADHNGDFSTSNSSVQAGLAGTWNWTATFSGDGNNGKAAGACGDEAVVIDAASIHIVKKADAPQVDAGDQIGFTLTVYNDGKGDARGVALSDKLPVKTDLSWSIAAQGAGWAQSCKIDTGVLTCGGSNGVTVAAGTTQAASTFTVHIISPTTADTGGDCPSGSGVVDNTGSVTATNGGSDESKASTCVAAPAVSITKTADHSAAVHAGDQIGFTVEVKNNGSGDATKVKLSDPLPAGSGSGVTWSIDSSVGNPAQFALGGPKGGQTLALASTTLPAGADYRVHIVASTSETECSTYDNTATLTTGNANNPAPVSASESCAYRVDLEVTKSGSPASQALGDGNITWTIVVTNHGPDTDTGVTVSDPMPAGNTFVSATSSVGSCIGGAILNCTIGAMAADEQVTITLVTTPSTVGQQTNKVIVSGDRPETNTSNNTATATVETVGPHTPPVFCVAVSRVTPKQLYVGRKTKLTIHVTQHGKAVEGIRVQISGPKVDVRTKPSNHKGVIARSIKLKRAGILIFSPIASKRCNTQRVGVTNVFTPPVTG